MGGNRSITLRSDWDTYRIEVMFKALREKFSIKNRDLRKKLIATGTAKLAEASPYDDYWGTGKSGTGLNKLGELLEIVRKEIVEESVSKYVPEHEQELPSSDPPNFLDDQLKMLAFKPAK